MDYEIERFINDIGFDDSTPWKELEDKMKTKLLNQSDLAGVVLKLIEAFGEKQSMLMKEQEDKDRYCRKIEEQNEKLNKYTRELNIIHATLIQNEIRIKHLTEEIDKKENK